jgi:plastocyanin
MRHTKSLLTLAGFAVLTLISLPKVVRPLKAGPPPIEVRIDNFSFTPATLTVKAGTPITWVNGDDIPHTVISDDRIIKSKVLDTDEKFTFTPSKPGTYTYFCSIHPKMTGKLVVD